MTVALSKAEAQILTDVLGMILNDPDWQDMASATDPEWEALGTAYSKISAVAR